MEKLRTYTEKIYTKNGITKENVFLKGESVLHIGSGSNVLKGAETIDILDLPGVDTVHDLDVFPWPYADNTFDVVFAQSVVEHLTDIVKVMEELHRVLKKEGRIVMAVPYFRSVDAFTDPTHKIFFTRQSMDYFTQKDNSQANYCYTKGKFKEVGFWYGWPTESANPIVRFFKRYIYRESKFYDSHLSLLFPMKILIWELEAIK